mmetsp:Transcript_14732/g.21041  ORF Transcript_14732/g.21041 Transcript_14732/m.21041 type:complete len:307 (-) Transcript_14732:531-1451(-)
MKVILHYTDNANSSLHKVLKITLPKSWKNGPTSKILNQFVESYNASDLGQTNPLIAKDMHLALPHETDDPNRKEDSNIEEINNIIPSDAITYDVIDDRATIWVKHGPSTSLATIAAEKQRKADEQKAYLERTVACAHFGCNQRFPKGGPYPPCTHHLSPPVFHETAKFWSCCPNKKAYDWDEFQSIPGCRTGSCSETREDEGGAEFLGGCDLREQMMAGKENRGETEESANGTSSSLKSIEDFNKSSNKLDSVRNSLAGIGVEVELFDQVVNGIEKSRKDCDVTTEMGKLFMTSLKAVAAQQQRIS